MINDEQTPKLLIVPQNRPHECEEGRGQLPPSMDNLTQFLSRICIQNVLVPGMFFGRIAMLHVSITLFHTYFFIFKAIMAYEHLVY